MSLLGVERQGKRKSESKKNPVAGKCFSLRFRIAESVLTLTIAGGGY